jgi:hypothetical protein
MIEIMFPMRGALNALLTLIIFLALHRHNLDLTAQIFLLLNQLMMNPQQQTTSDEQFDRNFKPKGAMAFFVLLVILGLIIWFGIYFLMLNRI